MHFAVIIFISPDFLSIMVVNINASRVSPVIKKNSHTHAILYRKFYLKSQSKRTLAV